MINYMLGYGWDLYPLFRAQGLLNEYEDFLLRASLTVGRTQKDSLLATLRQRVRELECRVSLPTASSQHSYSTGEMLFRLRVPGVDHTIMKILTVRSIRSSLHPELDVLTRPNVKVSKADLITLLKQDLLYMYSAVAAIEAGVPYFITRDNDEDDKDLDVVLMSEVL